MRRIAAVAGTLMAAMFFSGLVIGAEPPGKIVLKVYPKRAVTFDHKGHAKRIGNCHMTENKKVKGSCKECPPEVKSKL